MKEAARMEKGTGATVRKALREQPQLDLRRMSNRPGEMVEVKAKREGRILLLFMP